MSGSGPKSQVSALPSPEPTAAQMRFCVELAPRWQEFRSNVAAAFTRTAKLPTRVRPGYFWSDVFVNTRAPWTRLRQSYVVHAFALTLLYACTYWGLFSPHRVPTHNPFDHTTLTYYHVSEYLPPLNVEKPQAAPAKVTKKGDPEYAKQEIISVRPNADNTRQTIVSPFEVKLEREVALPNIVANAHLPAPPASAITRTAAQVKLDALAPKPVAPAPSITRQAAPKLADLAPSPTVAAPSIPGHAITVPRDILALNVVPPAPVITGATAPKFDVPTSAVAPPPASDALRHIGQMNIANLEPTVNASLAVPAQQAIAAASNGAAHPAAAALAQIAGGGGQPVAPAPGGIPGNANSPAVGQLVALGLHPAAVTGPIEVPHGSRSGTFAATPSGHPGAAGTPDLHGDGKANGAGGTSTDANDPLNGIHVGGGAGAPSTGVVVAGTPTLPPQSAIPKGTTMKGGGIREMLMASLKKPTDLAANTRPADSLPSAAKPGDEVFGAKKYYTMQLNMPNLTSASGTWIMEFAELRQTRETGDVTAPVALAAVHPAYPAELIRDRVEGTVTLYAVIHTDGTVGDVRVLRGVNDRLDASARTALQQWRFRPGTKNGSAVDIEAVVQIPFVASRHGF
jgi:TonB family protein